MPHSRWTEGLSQPEPVDLQGFWGGVHNVLSRDGKDYVPPTPKMHKRQRTMMAAAEQRGMGVDKMEQLRKRYGVQARPGYIPAKGVIPAAAMNSPPQGLLGYDIASMSPEDRQFFVSRLDIEPEALQQVFERWQY